MDLANHIGQQLKRKRLDMGMTQIQMAELLDISLTYYGEVERGNKLPSLELFAFACEKLKLDPSLALTGFKSSDALFAEVLLNCPKEKRFDFEQLLRYASNLYK